MSLTLKEYPPELNQHVEPYRKAHGQDPKWPEFEDDLIRKWCVDNHRPDIIITDSGPDTPIAPTTKQPETKPLGIPYEQGQIPQPFTAEGDLTKAGGFAKGDEQRLAEAPMKSFMRASAKLGATAIRLAPTAIANVINPAGGLLIEFSKEGKAVQAIADKEANKVVDYWKPSEEETKRLAEAGIPEKVAFGIADFIGQYPQFMVAGALGGGVVANLAKSLGVDAKVILQALPTVKKLIGAKKTVELASAIPGNIVGFGTKGTAETYGETGSAKEAIKAGAQEAALMGALPLNRLVTKALQPLTAAGAGFGLGMAQTGDVKEATTQGLMFLAMELPGMIKPEHRPIIEKAQKEPTPENKTEAVKIIEKDYQATTPEQKQELNKGLTPEHKKLIDDLAAEKEALAAENVQLKADVVTDPLTQVKNRRGLEAVREGKTQSIIFDLDHFKKINDQHGHPVGDGVLQEVVNRTVPIAEKVGGEIGRIGGEEFVVLLPEGVDRAKVSEEIRTAIESAPANIYGKDIPFTVSVGHAKADATGDPWKTADKYLYEAKNSGRNKVMGEPTTEKAPEVAEPTATPAPPKAPAVKATPAVIGKAYNFEDQIKSGRPMDDIIKNYWQDNGIPPLDEIRNTMSSKDLLNYKKIYLGTPSNPIKNSGAIWAAAGMGKNINYAQAVDRQIYGKGRGIGYVIDAQLAKVAPELLSRSDYLTVRENGKILDPKWREYEKEHKLAIQQALASGKPVPPEVLADYPDLKPAKETRARVTIKPQGDDLKLLESLIENNRHKKVLPGGLVRDENGRVINRFGATSEYTADWRAMFGRDGSVKGVGKDEVIRIYEKVKAGETLTERQATAYEQIMETLKDVEQRNPEFAIADGLNPGDSFMKDGEKHFVKEITEDGKIKIINGTTEYLHPGETIEIDRGTLEKTVTEKTPAGDQAVMGGMAGREMPRGPIKQTPSAKSDRGTIFDQEGLKTDREVQAERGQTELGIKTLDAIMSSAKEKQIINDTVRKLGPEKAFEKLRQDGYNITLDEMKQLGSQVMGGAKPRREAYAIINDTFSKNFDKDASIKTAAEEANAGIGIKQTEGQLKDITDRWIRANGRELNTEVSEMMNAIKVNPEFIKEFISRNKPDDFNQADLTLHHNETEQMLSEHNLTAQDLNRIGKDGTEWLLKSAKLTEITNRTAIAAKELMARSLDKSLPDGERAAYEVQARQMMTAVWNLAQKDVLTARQTGRALEYRKQGKNVDAQNIISSINEAMREPGVNLSRAQIQELFTKIAGLKTGQPLLSAIRKTTFGNWFWHWYYSSILSGLRTHFKNIGDTFINGVVEQLTNVIIDPESAGSVLKEYSLGFGKGLGTAIKETGRAFALKPINPAIVEVHQKFEQAQQTGPVGNVAWKILDIPGRIMSAWDLGNQMPTKAAAVSSITKGRMPTEFELIQAAHESRRAAYNNEPEGWVGIIADHVGQVTNRVRPAKFIVPFTRIVANVFNSGLDYTPLGIKRAFEYKTDSPEWRQKQNQQRFGTDKSPYAQRDFQKQLARVAIGTTAMGLMAALGKDRISGSGPQDYNKKDELKKTGWQEYSVKIGDKWISYQNLGSFSLPLSIVGNYLDAHKYKNMEEDNIIDRTSYALMGIGRTMMDKSFLSGASTLMQGIERQDKKYLQRIATQPITAINPNIIKQISDLFDPNIKAPQTTAQRIIRSFRPLGQSGVPNRIDIFGRPVTKTALERASGFLGLSMIEARGTEPVLEALIKQGVFLSGVKQVNINKGDANEKELKGNDLVEYRKIRGQLVRKYLDLSAEEIYANADDKDELFKIAGRITDRATREAKIQFGQRVKPKKFNPNATPGPPTPKIRF